MLLVLCAAGCGGINASVPISPMLFMQNSAPSPAPTVPVMPALAAYDAPALGQ